MISDELMNEAKSKLVDARMRGNPLLIEYHTTDVFKPVRHQRIVIKGEMWAHDDTILTITDPSHDKHTWWYFLKGSEIGVSQAFKRLERHKKWSLNWGSQGKLL